MSSMLCIKALPIFNDNYIWVLVNSKVRAAVCVDPGDDAPLTQWLNEQNLNLKAIVVTHHHQDHIGGIAKLKNIYPDAHVYGPDDARITTIDTFARDGDIFSIPGFAEDFKVISTPGHTTSHICYYSAQNNALFCGDTLFSAGCGRLFEGSAKEMHDSLQKLACLPDKTKLYPTHEYTKNNLSFALTLEPDNLAMKKAFLEASNTACTLPSTLEKEKSINPFLRIQQYLEHPGKLNNINANSFKDEVTLFQIIRELKDSF